MPFIEMGKEFGAAKETPLAPDGEYDLKIKSAEQPDGKDYIIATIEFEGEDYRPFNHFVNLVNKDKDARTDEEKDREKGTTSRNKMLFIKRFLNAFNIPFTNTGFDTADLFGATARLPVSSEMGRNNRRNQTLVLPELPEESQDSKAA